MQNQIFQWFADNPATLVVIVIVVLFVMAIIVFMYYNKRDLLYKAALYGVAKAEEAWGSGMGKVKFAEVYTYLKKEYPFITLLFTECQLSAMIEMALEQLKEILATKAAQEEQKKQQETVIENTLIDIEPSAQILDTSI